VSGGDEDGLRDRPHEEKERTASLARARRARCAAQVDQRLLYPRRTRLYSNGTPPALSKKEA
jgi:hypothetical protein